MKLTTRVTACAFSFCIFQLACADTPVGKWSGGGIELELKADGTGKIHVCRTKGTGLCDRACIACDTPDGFVSCKWTQTNTKGVAKSLRITDTDSKDICDSHKTNVCYTIVVHHSGAETLFINITGHAKKIAASVADCNRICRRYCDRCGRCCYCWESVEVRAFSGNPCDPDDEILMPAAP